MREGRKGMGAWEGMSETKRGVTEGVKQRGIKGGKQKKKSRVKERGNEEK